MSVYFILFFFSSRRRHTRCALVTGVQTCALPISGSICECRLAAGEGQDRLYRATLARRADHHANGGQSEELCRGFRGMDDPQPRLLDRHAAAAAHAFRSEEHTSELQSLMRHSYAVFCLKNKITKNIHHTKS